MNTNRSITRLTVLVFGFAFLYVPIMVLIGYSFNENKRVNVWTGFSTKWYGELLRDEQILNAALTSLKIAFVSATFAVVLGTLAAMSMVRFKKFKGRTLFSGMISAPLVMPEVITGISLLLLFVTMGQLFGWPEQRGSVTVIIAHITFCAAYTTVVVQSRLVSLDPSLEEAAMDLGAKPVTVFTQITLPIIAPSLAAGWLLSFTLSLDDLVIATFTTGPSATTLPMLIFSKVRLGVSPDINALASILVLLVAIGVLVAGIVMHRQETQRQRDEQMAASE